MQGIITGIGNEITPEIDAVINDFIVGKNTILKGLELNGNILSAGTCILCGYRGTLENSKTVDGNYVYGKFVIGVNETDSFSIFTSSSSTEPTDGIINPTSITSAGTYYLRLYANGVSQVDSERYPSKAVTSDRARDLIAGGTIDSKVTTPTAPLNNNSTRVANTKYVHKQIEKEIDEGIGNTPTTVKYTWTNSGVKFSHTITILPNIKRRAKYCIASISISVVGKRESDGTIMNGLVHNYTKTTVLGELPKGYYPNQNQEMVVSAFEYNNTTYAFVVILQSNGQIVLKNDAEIFSGLANPYTTKFILGYEI